MQTVKQIFSFSNVHVIEEIAYRKTFFLRQSKIQYKFIVHNTFWNLKFN